MKNSLLLLKILLIVVFLSFKQERNTTLLNVHKSDFTLVQDTIASTFAISELVPAGPNSWLMSNSNTTNTVTLEGISHWSDTNQQFETYVLVIKPGDFNIVMNARQLEGTAIINVSALANSKNVVIKGSETNRYNLGTFHVDSAQYVKIHLKAIESLNGSYLEINSYTFLSNDTSQKFRFITLNQDKPMLWARRGPAQHISFKFPSNIKAEVFYTELTVPVGSDKPGSYFMADGFSGGYFGIQNSAKNVKRILFSVWTAKRHNNWVDVPDSEKTMTVRIGTGVELKHFHDGGTGNGYGLKYDWIPGNTYKFLVKDDVDTVKNTTTYTAWFYAPEKREWILIAAVKKPLYAQYFKGLYSFIENFITSTGNMERAAYYGNQWLLNTEGKWGALDSASLDGKQNEKKNRFDYNHGIINGMYFMSGFGFIYSGAPATQVYHRTKTQIPDIDFTSLP